MDSRSQTASRQRRPFLRAVERLGPGGTFVLVPGCTVHSADLKAEAVGRGRRLGRFPCLEAGAGTAVNARGAGAGRGSEAADVPKDTLGWRRGPSGGPATLSTSLADQLTQQCGRPSARKSDSGSLHRRCPPVAERARGSFPGRRADSGRGWARDRPGWLRVLGAALLPAGPALAFVGGARRIPTQTEPDSPLAGVRRVHLLLLRGHDRRRRGRYRPCL